MADDQALQPDDFPVHAEQRKIVKSDGGKVADVCDKKTAEDVADRLNESETQRDQDRWSA